MDYIHERVDDDDLYDAMNDVAHDLREVMIRAAAKHICNLGDDERRVAREYTRALYPRADLSDDMVSDTLVNFADLEVGGIPRINNSYQG